MTVTIKAAPVRKAITVAVSPEAAFARFVESIGTWWPSAYSIGGSPQKTVVIEPRALGRWYEIGEDGSQCDWGEVVEWDPPARLVLAWRIGADWRFDSTLLTEVEIRFVPAGADGTRVELEHRLLENMGAAAEAARASFDSEQGWLGVLASYAAATSD
jgi:uncharacterized protein YndB with AHSA1/START domain